MKIISILLLIAGLYSCTNDMNGKIEVRQNRVYIVNTSTNEAYKFTIKKTQSLDTLHDYETFMVELAPGEERYLSDISEMIDTGYSTQIKRVPVKDTAKLPPLPKGYTMVKKDDTVINGETYIFEEKPDTTLGKRVVISNNYKVTGQLKLQFNEKYTTEK